jgi:hypothetical protein
VSVVPVDLLPHLRRARDVADRNYAEPLDLAALAAAAKGTMHGFGIATDDCRKTFAELTAKGVEFIQEPADRPYGVEALLRDNSGNWLVLVEQKEYSAADFS